MKISVLMSVYYKEKKEYLILSLESILNQTRMPDEIVIIKDGKLTKELDEVLEKYKTYYTNLIKIYELKENNGLGLALKFGVKKCKYEYIARMDTDDIAYPDRLEEQEKILEKNPDLDILGGNIEEYDDEMKKMLSMRKVPISIQEIKKYMKTQSPFNHGTVIMKKSAILKVGNYQDIQFEDYELWARMLVNGCKMQNMDKTLVKFRAGDEMYERRGGIKRIKGIVEMENKLLNYKIINIFEYIYNIMIRSTLVLIPKKLKKCVYIKIIRKVN